MKVLLASLALLPVIASHVYLQLPPFSINSPSTSHQLPVGLHQYSQQDLIPSQINPEASEEENPETSLVDYLASASHVADPSLSRDPLLRQSRRARHHDSSSSSISQDSSAEGRHHDSSQDSSAQGGDTNLKNDWRDFNMAANLKHLYPISADSHLEMLTAAKKSGEHQFSVRVPDGLQTQSKRVQGGTSSLPRYNMLPSAYRIDQLPSLHQPLVVSKRPLGSASFAHRQNHLAHNARPLSSNQLSFDDNITRELSKPLPYLDGARRTPSKRYLGIELPDYIAANYAADKAGNPRLNHLKQRMRNVGK